MTNDVENLMVMNRKHIALNYRMRGGFVLLAMIMLAPFLGWGQINITSLSQITAANGHYVITQDITGGTPGVTAFSGTLEANINTATKMPYRIKNLSAPLFTTLTGTVKNLVLEDVAITANSGNTGAIACTANGSARIYNVGILSGSVGGTAYTGGLVGLLDGEARVVNCYSYANITSGTNVGGIVGYNNVATASNNLKTMVFGCMFYGEITGGTNKAPIYNGTNIVNKDANGVSNFNYFRAEASFVQPTGITYNCALMAETRYLQRFEFFRHLLNGHRELAGWWATGTYSSSQMHKWVMIPDSIGTAHPYPVLKQSGKYPSVVNYDAEHATTGKPRNQGGKLGELAVTIQMGSGGAAYAPPTGAEITTSNLTLNILDKDPDHFNFNYYKVQLPYYNDVGTKNYNGNRVVTGWKIVKINGSTTGTGSFTTGDDVTYDENGNIITPYNFADRHCTNKDLYSSTNKRVFNQGAYWDVPEGVTSITIEPYWAKAAYLADAYVDVVYNQAMSSSYNVPNVGGGQIFTNDQNSLIAGENQKVYTSIGNARDMLDKNKTVYDCAIVLVGNAHNIGVSYTGSDRSYTIMSIDADHDNEPDYSYVLRFNSRNKLHPVRVDFINIPGLGMAQKSTGGTGSYNLGILNPIGWFESTNTSLFRVTQFEYDHSSRGAAPYIVQGGVFEQWVSGQSGKVANKTTYFHVGGNVYFKEFHRGTHQDYQYTSKHPPVSVTGGDYDEFYLTGLYRGDVDNFEDNAECYINGGRFGIMAGAGMEGIGKEDGADNTGNVVWQIQNADIREFYAGGINAAHPVEGNLNTTIIGSHVDVFCGGPKFGDMSTGKTVTTTATGCTFGTFFGAGYGGNSYSRQAPFNHNNIINFPHNNSQAGNHSSWNHWLSQYYLQTYNATYGGVSTQFNYQFLPMSGNADNCARIFVEYVKFSLATALSVTSTLKDCTVTGNFYGGGSLGKVDGPVTSTLDSCVVNGNVYGAGFSASRPTVEVDSIGFRIEPYYYDNLGTYRIGVKGQTTTYNWEQSTAIDIDKINHILYTTVDLSNTTLGSVQTVDLTLKGNTAVHGSVFGGGDASVVTGDTEVKILGNTKVYGNIYGGGNEGVVGGNTKVIVNGHTSTGQGTGSGTNPTNN